MQGSRHPFSGRRPNEAEKHTPIAFQVQAWLRPLLEEWGYGSDVITYTARRWGELLAEGEIEPSRFAGNFPGVGAVAVFVVPDLMDDLVHRPGERRQKALDALSQLEMHTELRGLHWEFDPQLQTVYFFEER